ncbi:50S ribosomal protein L4 [Oceanidesulfovibrio marinus]|uniref:Large ribosomal subunit protein uL4 n=1 Tax=Oceanidesulfovibrio marinus TaxID=370038 RepID=A0A6P1ZE37_9BACT|nr:50S ribosomal protein L4 [Oceanidesulfovibrio marinus]QJT07650.1 50S ribosomal protein L4 [Oceanidesulfovibrio marinus]TVM32007.1 50S ribosomal protein L4 [Oceanidesulfovibrio marinus]
MPTISVYDQTKKEVGTLELAPEVFEVAIKPEILHLVVRHQETIRRAGTHATKNRAKISGGGKKPWRQKGTGRARAGTTRSPLWRHGATVFGPQPREYGFKVNKKIKQLAMKMALSSRFAEEKLMIVKGFELPEAKTKNFVDVKNALGAKKVLIVVGEEDNTLSLSARNVPGVTVLTKDTFGVRDILVHSELILTEDAAKAVQERLS